MAVRKFLKTMNKIEYRRPSLTFSLVDDLAVVVVLVDEHPVAARILDIGLRLRLLLHLRVVNFLGCGDIGIERLPVCGGLLALGSEDVARQVGEHSVAL